MEIQKVKHLHLEEAKKNPNILHEYIVTEKYDGWFTYVDFDKFKGWSDVMSSRHRVIPSMTHCKETYFNKLPNPKSNCRLIMEAYIPDTCFYTANGIFNRSKGSCQALDVHFKLHDIVYFDNLMQRAISRYKHLLLLDDKDYFKERLEVVSALTISKDKKDWLKAFDVITYNGGEGVILKQSEGLYHPGKRNSSLMKIKLEEDVDILCIGIYETIGEKGNKNLNLKLVTDEGIEVNVRVGKHIDIDRFLTDPSKVVGKVCKIKAMKVNKDGSLREPRFDMVREDKS